MEDLVQQEELIEQQQEMDLGAEATPEVPEMEVSPEAEETPAPEGDPAPYELNSKYSFMDEEFEFDDKTKTFIKSKEDEDLFRDFYTSKKAHEKYKSFGSIRDVETKLGEFDGLSEKAAAHDNFQEEIGKMGQMLQQGTAGFDQFLKHVGVDKNLVMQYAVEQAQMQTNPEQAAQMQQQYQMQQQNFDLQYQNQMMQNSIQEQQVQRQHVELDGALESNPVANAYDNLVGTQGSFKQAVIEHGAFIEQTQGRIVSQQEAIAAVQAKYQNVTAYQNAGMPQGNPSTQQTLAKPDPQQTVVIRENKQTLPNVQGGSASPARKKLTSLDSIREHAKTLS